MSSKKMRPPISVQLSGDQNGIMLKKRKMVAASNYLKFNTERRNHAAHGAIVAHL